MKQFKIFTKDDAVLHQKAALVSLPLSEEKEQLILDMVDYLKCSQDEEIAEINAIICFIDA